MSAKGRMVPAGPCEEVYPSALDRGELIPCEKTTRHWKHLGHDKWTDANGKPKIGTLTWWGEGLTDDEKAEAERLRAMGGVDEAKRMAWFLALGGSLGL